MLIALLSTLPDECGTAIFEQGDTRIFLISGPGDVDPEGIAAAGQRAGDLLGADSPTAAIRNIILPDHKSAVLGQGDVRKNLIARQVADNRVFRAVGGVVILCG